MRQIAMLGTAPSTRSQAPFDREDWEIWGQADYWEDMKHITRWYEFAPLAKLHKDFPKYMEFLKAAEHPIYMRDHFEEIPRSIKFPFDDMAKRFGVEFMTATVVWMICHAVVEHIDGNEISTIGLWGYDMALDAEYAHQRPGIRHMQWVCQEYLTALGKPPIVVMVPRGSDLSINPIPYPFAEDDLMVCKIRARKRDINRKMAAVNRTMLDHRQQALDLETQLAHLRGALEDCNYFERMACGVKTPAA